MSHIKWKNCKKRVKTQANENTTWIFWRGVLSKNIPFLCPPKQNTNDLPQTFQKILTIHEILKC